MGFMIVVNTRCIFYQLDASSTSLSNLTMCPILDFANHTPSDTQIVPLMPSNNAPRPLKPDPRTPRAKVGGDYTFISSGMGLERDQEIFLRYGGHSNRKLFVEYGFVNLWPEGSVLKGEVTAEVDVEDIIQGLFEKRGALGVWMKRVLEEEGYWGYYQFCVYTRIQLTNGIYFVLFRPM